MSLNPNQFKGPLYHGTTFDLQGKDIKPANTLDSTKSNWGDLGHSGQRSGQHAFATESEDTAWQFGSQSGMMKRAAAGLATQRNAAADAQIDDPRIREMVKDPVPDVGRVRVHEVAPNPMMQRGVYHGEHPSHQGGSEDLKEWKSPAFRSKGTIDIMPGRQGTFPSLNWNQFRGPHSGYASDMNHPTDSDISEGHEPAGDKDAIRARMERLQDRMRGTKSEPVPSADEHQMDLFTGKTVLHHAENDDSELGDYHRNNLFGRL